MSTATTSPFTSPTTPAQQQQTTAAATTTTTSGPPSWSCDTHRRAREAKQQQLQLTTLLAELRRATHHWFQTKSDECFHLVVQTCVRILQHGLLLPSATNGGTQRLIEDFEFLRATQLQLPHGSNSQHAPTQLVSVFLQQWVTSCLQQRCLTRCLQTLAADRELLDTYYQPDVALLRHSTHATALFVCLTAVQLDQSSLLSQLEPLQRRQRHRRTSSQPNFSNVTQRLQVVQEEELLPQHAQKQPQQQQQQQQLLLLRRIKSLPSLQQSSDHSPDSLRPRCQTYNSRRARWTEAERELELPLSGCSLSTASSGQLTPRRVIQLINCDDIKIWTDQTNNSSSGSGNSSDCNTMTPTATGTAAAAISKRGSPSLNGWLGKLFGSPPVYTSWYQRGLGHDDETSSVLDTFGPVNGRKLDKRQQQSLFEGISMLDYAQAETEQETMTAPLDIVGCHQVSGASCSSSTPCSTLSTSENNSYNSKRDNQSLAAFLQMSRYAHNNTELEKENAHFRISEACITAIEHVKWSRRRRRQRHNSSSSNNSSGSTNNQGQGDTFIDAETIGVPFVEQQHSLGAGNNNSAEAVGLQLISRFKDQQLPKLGDLKWLVSEQDAPQQLLPLPKPLPQQQQQLQEESACLTRGTRTWAPPRQQIIFTEHPALSRTELLKRQQYRCAGCGMHVARQYQQHFRYCNYLGKYLCTGCHRNQMSAIPAKILHSWDFRCYAVSSFAYRLIEQMYTFPLFHVPDLQPELYGKQKALARARKRRLQLKYAQDFISACRFATREQALFSAVPTHITNEPDMWSMCDFVDAQNNSMRRSIEELIALSEQHINNCVLCTGRAFVCEYCKSPKLIYRWQRKVQRCAQCGVCSHYKCWKAASSSSYHRCQRCDRLHQRSTAS
ncbi:run domain Beclin-1-interacting and cysteine-rich domain-containing protein [Drosophila sulfurigaster albostrigata]|uniref:run domain Beclin-1-interacting and cysteine-rich domain-containing protein n=1 Tax=Drosophila sulfurigaster albostrigata TaxID=89887 RepID=UPI002D2192BC|nr:run domain Beclin-1-interacting and cysteine-rich domain-containing protein [Drosophila sulfurigaster albostrigata]